MTDNINKVSLHTAALSAGIMSSYNTDKAEQRYLKLLKSRPDLFQKIPQYQIAGYVGVKPESLSRIRKRLLGK